MLGLSAEDLGTVILAASLALIALLGGMKGKAMAQGTRSPRKEDVLEVAGAIVSDKAVDAMVKSLNATTDACSLLAHAISRDVDAKEKLTAALASHGTKLDRNSETAEDMRETIQSVDTRVERLKDELIRFQFRR